MARKRKPTIDRLHYFWTSLSREEFYEVYEVMTALTGPACGDYIVIETQIINLKRMVRLLRITIMGERFAVDYGVPYTSKSIRTPIAILFDLYPKLASQSEKDSVAKIVKALRTVKKWLEQAEAVEAENHG